MDFEKRLEKAIQRGQQESQARAQAEAQKEVSEQELRRLHAQNRLELSEHIETCLHQLSDHLLGFQFEVIVSDRGWGASVSRDNLEVFPDRTRKNLYSRLELVVRPMTSSHVLELAGKATVRNRELFNRSQYQRLTEVDLATFEHIIDLWVLEFAEVYSAEG